MRIVSQSTRTWYYSSAVAPTHRVHSVVEELNFGEYDVADSGSISGEGAIRWYAFSVLQGGRRDPAMKIEVFAAGFEALADDVHALMRRFPAGERSASPDEVLTFLVGELGYEDGTEEVGPLGIPRAEIGRTEWWT